MVACLFSLMYMIKKNMKKQKVTVTMAKFFDCLIFLSVSDDEDDCGDDVGCSVRVVLVVGMYGDSVVESMVFEYDMVVCGVGDGCTEVENAVSVVMGVTTLGCFSGLSILSSDVEFVT
mmetsp:Transcript_53652/g.64706  ORF Transcript_53652/g.64706 Transcript_53652/m.64706 type:complete len:118 (-) Transcript_53652:582-935(-)